MPLTDKLYETLTPAQRLAAMVPAMARRDAAESARLFGTAPKFHYHAPDLEFLRGMRAVERMALHTALAMHRETAQWLLCLAVVGHGLTPEGELPVEDLEQAQAQGQAAMRSAKASWLAYTEACAGLGVNADEAMRAVGVLGTEATIHSVLDTPVEPDPETLEAMRALMAVIVGEAW
uniref:Uncharacterized protein n=1 Tax=mine drainage metagenome TaxID=410659 RepID=E6PLG4_9ZZZZ